MRSLADDPQFLASLSNLDAGLSGKAEPETTAQPLPQPRFSASELPLPQLPPWLTPSACAAVSAASAALSAAFDPPLPELTPSSVPFSAPAAGASHMRLDLFPLAESRHALAPNRQLRERLAPPPIAAVQPPRMPVARRRLPAATPPPGATYEQFYGLDEKPFAESLDLRFLYRSSAHDRVLQDLVMSVGRCDALVVITGEPGIGKTTLCHALVDRLDRRTLVSLSSGTIASADDLLKALLVDFGVVSSDDAVSGRLASASRDDLTGAVQDFFGSLAARQASALMIVDEAHRLPRGVLRELRVLSEMAAALGRLQIVLAGEPELTRLLRASDLRPLDERVSLRVDLEPLEDDDVTGYVAHRLAVAGRSGRVDFDDAAIRAIFTFSGGVPRVVNQICDRAMTLGYKASASRIDSSFVEEAAQQIGRARSGATRLWKDRVVVAALMIVMALAGAAGAGLVFRQPLKRVWTHWRGGDPPISATPR
jgi:general secretion pathway protein A